MSVQFALNPEGYSHAMNIGIIVAKSELPGVSSDRRKRKTDRRERRSRRRTIRKKEEKEEEEKKAEKATKVRR